MTLGRRHISTIFRTTP